MSEVGFLSDGPVFGIGAASTLNVDGDRRRRRKFPVGFRAPEVEMGKLSSKARKKLPASDFAGPGRSYPVNDKSHAANAKARATQAVKAGRMSKAAEQKVDAKANKVLGSKKTSKKKGK